MLIFQMGFKSRLSNIKKSFKNVFKCSDNIQSKKSVKEEKKRKSMLPTSDLQTIKEDSPSTVVPPLDTVPEPVTDLYSDFIDLYRWEIFMLESSLNKRLFPYQQPCSNKDILRCIEPLMEALFAVSKECAALHHAYIHSNEEVQREKLESFYRFIDKVTSGSDIPHIYSRRQLNEVSNASQITGPTLRETGSLLQETDTVTQETVSDLQKTVPALKVTGPTLKENVSSLKKTVSALQKNIQTDMQEYNVASSSKNPFNK